jgi:hypothetical protein
MFKVHGSVAPIYHNLNGFKKNQAILISPPN